MKEVNSWLNNFIREITVNIKCEYWEDADYMFGVGTYIDKKYGLTHKFTIANIKWVITE